MNAKTDMSKVIVPRSDQLNTDDLISGPRTIRITKVTIASTNEQPVSVYFEGDNSKPWKPCKSMCRLLVAAWGPDASVYAGRSVTLFRDPTVLWAGLEVGGIRISHMSHIERDIMVALTVTRGKRAPFTVKVLREQKRESQPPEGESESERIQAELLDMVLKYADAKELDDVLDVDRWRREIWPRLSGGQKKTAKQAADLAMERVRPKQPADAGDAYEETP